MEAFYKTHSHLIELLNNPVRRALMDEIDWDDRVICIRGCRGVGKTTFLLQYAKEFYGRSKKCLYVNMDNFYFCKHSFLDFVDEFVAGGGKVLLIDQAGKLPDWTKLIKTCYEKYSTLKIICAISSVVNAEDDCHEMNDIAKIYRLNGLSFREYLNLSTVNKYNQYTLDDLIENHDKIISTVTHYVEPLDFFQNYLHHGYFPFLIERKSLSETMLRAINRMLEIDILLVRQIELKYLFKIKTLLYKLATTDTSLPVNISHLSDEIQSSRATVMNYLKYMKDAGLIMMLYPEYEEYPKKPSQIMLGNPNISYAIAPTTRQASINEVFVINALTTKHVVNKSKRSQSYIVDNKWILDINKPNGGAKQNHDELVFSPKGGGESVRIPLWLLGFID